MAQGSSRRFPACLQTHLYRGKTNEHFVKKKKTNKQNKTNKKKPHKKPLPLFLYFLSNTHTHVLEK